MCLRCYRPAMSRPKLTYFDFSGSRGEECRLALVAAGIDFEDNRIKRPDWAALKPTTPFGSVPYLEVDGKQLGESNAILSYVGNQHGLLPSDPWEQALAQAVLSAGEGMRAAVTKTFGLPDDKVQAAREELVNGPLTSWAANLEKQIQGPFFGGAGLGIADIKIFMVASWFEKGVLDHVPTDVLQAYPKLQAVMKGVREEPKIAAWLAKEH